MLRLLDLRIASSGGFMDAVRWMEYVALLIIGVAALAHPHPLSFLAVVPFSLLALLLIPGRPTPALSRERLRFDTLSELHTEGYGLHTRWLDVSDLPLSDAVALSQWEIRRDTLIWISRCRARLQPFPELAGIFEAHQPMPNVIDELDACLQTLSRLRRLVSLSRSLKLPI